MAAVDKLVNWLKEGGRVIKYSKVWRKCTGDELSGIIRQQTVDEAIKNGLVREEEVEDHSELILNTKTTPLPPVVERSVIYYWRGTEFTICQYNDGTFFAQNEAFGVVELNNPKSWNDVFKSCEEWICRVIENLAIKLKIIESTSSQR